MEYVNTYVINQTYYHLYIMHDKDFCPYLAACKAYRICFLNCLHQFSMGDPKSKIRLDPEHIFYIHVGMN